MKKQILAALLFLNFSFAFAQDVTITDNLPASAPSGQSIDAMYTLNKSANVGSFAKFQLDLPVGFEAQSLETKGGNFTFENSRVKIVWVSLPGDASFSFSFKITVPASVSGDKNFAAQFFYLENNVKKQFDVPAHSVSFGGASDNTVAATTTEATPAATPADNTTTTTPGDNATTTPADNVTPADNTATTNTVAVNSSSENTTTSTPTVEPTPTNTTPSTPTAAVAKSGNAVFYIQVAALSGKPNKTLFAQYGTLKIVEDGGLFKVLVGNYKSLEEARKHKPEMAAKGATGCFVVGYENGVKMKL